MRWIKALLAAAALAALVVAPPWWLATTIGVPWPAEGIDLSAPLTDSVILDAGAAVCWLLWAQAVACVLVEIVAVTRRDLTRPLPGTFGVQRELARILVGAVAAATVAAPTVAAAISSTAMVGDHVRTSAQTTSQTTIKADVRHHENLPAVEVTREQRTLWALADAYLGDGERWSEIADLNTGRTMPNGKTFTAAMSLRPGWRLVMPADAQLPNQVALDAEGSDYIVKPGDTLWNIADQCLGDPTRYPEIFNANRGRVQPGGDQLTDPDHIEPGWSLAIPGAQPDQHGPADTGPTRSDSQAKRPPDADNTEALDPAENTNSKAGDQVPEPTPQARASESPSGRGPVEAPPTSAGPAACPAETSQNADEDSFLGAPWVLPGLTGGGLLLAGALFLGLQQRRRTQFRARRPGRAIAAPDPELAAAEMTITAAGAPAAATVDFMDAALRRMAAANKPGGSMPPLAAVELGEGALTLHLSGEADLPPPWEGTPDRLHWQCRTDVDVNDLGAEPDDVEAPYPLLVTIGISDDGATWLLNCEELGTLTVTGDPTKCRDFARHLAAQVAVSPWSRSVTVDCVGVGEETAPLGERIHYHEPGAAGGAVAADVLVDAVAMADRAGRHDTDVMTGRTGQVDGDVWPARLLLVDADTEEPDALSDLLELVDGQVGRTATSVVVAGERDSTPGFVLEVTGGGRVRLELAGLDLVAVGLSGEEARGCGLLYAQSENLADVEVPVDETADEGWQAYADQAGSLRREHTLPRSMPADEIDEPTGSILDGDDDEYLRQAAAVPEDLEALAPQVPASVRDEVEQADPTLDQDVADWLGDHCDRPRLSLLGPIGARTHGKALAKRKPYFTELLAFLALRRRNGVTLDEICDAFGIGAGRARDYVNTVRYWLGTNPRTGEPYLPHADKSPAAKARGVNVYQVDDDLLIDADMFRRLRLRGEGRGGTEGLGDLITALELVTGRPFDQQRKGGWTWLANGERLDEYMTVAIADVAFIVATSCLERGEVVRARAAAELAVLAAPHEEATRLCMVRVAEAEGDHREAERILREEVCNRSDDGDAPTELSERTEKIIRAQQWLVS